MQDYTETGEKVELPQPEELSNSEKQQASNAYLMMFASIGLGLPLPLVNLGVSIGYWLYYRKKSKFVTFHSLQSLLSQLPITLCNTSIIVSFIMYLIRDFDGFKQIVPWYIFVALLNLVYVVYSIFGSVYAKRGRFFYFLFFGRAAFSIVYKSKSPEKSRKSYHNTPPSGF